MNIIDFINAQLPICVWKSRNLIKDGASRWWCNAQGHSNPSAFAAFIIVSVTVVNFVMSVACVLSPPTRYINRQSLAAKIWQHSFSVFTAIFTITCSLWTKSTIIFLVCGMLFKQFWPTNYFCYHFAWYGYLFIHFKCFVLILYHLIKIHPKYFRSTYEQIEKKSTRPYPLSKILPNEETSECI